MYKNETKEIQELHLTISGKNMWELKGLIAIKKHYTLGRVG